VDDAERKELRRLAVAANLVRAEKAVA